MVLSLEEYFSPSRASYDEHSEDHEEQEERSDELDT